MSFCVGALDFFFLSHKWAEETAVSIYFAVFSYIAVIYKQR